MNFSDVNFKSSLYNSSSAQTQGTKDVTRPEGAARGSQGTASGIPQAVTAKADAAIEKALEDAGLPKNPRNTDIARQMIELRMPLDANSLKKIITQANMYREVDVSTLLLMNVNDIPVDRFTATQLQAYLNNEQNLSNQLADAANAVLDMLSQEASEGGTEVNLAVLELLAGDGAASEITEGFNGLSETYAGNGAAVVQEALLQNTAEHSAAAAQITGSNGMLNQAAATLTNAANSTGILNSVIMTMVSHPENNIDVGAQNVVFAAMNGVGTDVDGSGTDVFNGFGSDAGGGMGGNQLGTGSSRSGITNGKASTPILTFPKDTLILSSLLDESELTEFEAVIRDFSVSSEDLGEESIEKALEQLREGISNASEEELEKLFSASSYRKLINRTLAQKLSLDVNELKNADSLNRYYRGTFSTLSKLHDLAEQNERVTNALEKPMDNVRFMDTLNNVFPYVQLPLKFGENNTHGELYVFKNGRSKTKPEEVQSVLLHLDMEHLGSTDIHMELKSRSLNIHFYANDEKSLNVLSESYDELKNSLETRNFIVDTKFTVRSEKENTSSMAEALAMENTSGPAFSYSFDIKA